MNEHHILPTDLPPPTTTAPSAFTRYDLVEIQANRPMGVVTGERPDPDAPGELLYAVTTWRSASELRRVLERRERAEVSRG